MDKERIIILFRKVVNFGFYSLVLFLPFSISAAQTALFIILLSWAALMLAEKRIIFARIPLNYPIFIYISAVIITAVFGIDFTNSLRSINKLWIVFVFFATLTFVKDMRMAGRLIHILFIVTSIASIYGVLQHIFPGLDIARPEGRKVVQWAEGGVAATGFFDHHMTYGGFLLLVFSLSFSLFLGNLRDRRQFKAVPNPLPFALYSLLILAGLMSSMTRSAWIGAMVAVIFIIMFKIKKRVAAFSAAGLILISITAYFFLLPISSSLHSPILNRFKNIFTISGNIERLYIWKSTMGIIHDRPVTGVGMNNYSLAIKNYRDKYNHEFSPGSDAHAHNNILTQTAEYGIVGLAAFLWIWIVFFKEGIKIYRLKTKEIKDGIASASPRNDIPSAFNLQPFLFQRAVVLGGLGAIAGFHVAGIFENNFGDAEVATIMWFIMGLVFLMKKIYIIVKFPI